MATLRRVREWLRSDNRDALRVNPPCPLCGRTTVGFVGGRGGVKGHGYWHPSREELIAHCPEHGRSPYNVPGGI